MDHVTYRDSFQPQPVCDSEKYPEHRYTHGKTQKMTSQDSPQGRSHMTAHTTLRGPYFAKAHIRQLRAALPLLSQVKQQNNKPLKTTARKVLPHGCRPALGSQSQAKAQAHCPGLPMPAACKHTYHHRRSCHLVKQPHLLRQKFP